MQNCLISLQLTHIRSFDAKSETSTEGEENQFRQDVTAHQQEFAAYRGGSSKAKSSLCKNFMEKGYCPYGGKCQFAHGPQELKINMEHNKSYKTKGCHAFAKKGYCCYGERCNFIHSRQAQDLDLRTKWSRIYCNHRQTFRSMGEQDGSKLLQLLNL